MYIVIIATLLEIYADNEICSMLSIYGQGILSYNKTAKELLAQIQKLDSENYPEVGPL